MGVKYVITDNNGKYLGKDKNDRFTIVTNCERCASWETKEKAYNVKNSCLSTRFKQMGFDVAEITIEDIKKVQEEMPELSLADILEDASHVGSFLTDANDKRKWLYHELSTVDREIGDVYHWIEFHRFNAYQGYKLSALLKTKLEHRRAIKDSIELLDIAVGLQSKVDIMNNRKYNPRELDELFRGDFHEDDKQDKERSVGDNTESG